MGRALMAGVLVAAVLAAPAIDKKPRIWAQPIAETTMDAENYAIRKAKEAGITVAPCINPFLAQPQRFHISGNFTGKNRILIELLEVDRDKAGAYARVYDELVSAIANAIKARKTEDSDDFDDADVSDRKVSQKEFIKGLWNIMDSALCMKYKGDVHMFSMIETGEFNCSTSSFLALDVAGCIDVWAEIVSVNGHQFIKTSDFFFETTSGEYYPLEGLHDHYPVIYGSTSDLSTTFSMDFEERAGDLIERGKNEKAVKYCNMAIEMDSMNVSAYFNRGVAYSNLGEYRKAILDYSRAMRLDPTDAENYSRRGGAFVSLMEYDKAIRDYEKAKRLNPKDPASYYNLGNLYSFLWRWKQAIREYGMAIRLGKGKKDLANYHFQRGYAYYRFGNDELTLGELAAMKPGEEEKGHKNPLFYSRFAFDNYIRSIRDCSAAIRLNPGEPPFYAQRADAYGKLGIKAKCDMDKRMADSLKRR